MRRALLLLLLLLPGIASAQEDTETPPISPQRLHDNLEQGARLFRRNPDGGAAKAYAASVAYADVDFEGRTVTVRDPWLSDSVAELDSAATKDERAKLAKAIAVHLAERAAAVDVEIASAAAKPAASPVDPDKVLAGVLEQRQFHEQTEDPRLAKAAASVREKIRSAWNRLKEFVRDIFSDEPRQETWGQRLRRLAAIGGAILTVIVGGYFLARAIVRASVDDARTADDADLPEEPPRPADMTAQADALAASGDLRGAVRALYLALLGELHAQGAIVYDRHRTNREYLRTMKLDPPRAGAFADAVELFDRKWYGRESCQPAELVRYRELIALAGHLQVLAA